MRVLTEDWKRALRRSLQSSLWNFTSSVLCPPNVSHLSLPELSALSSVHAEISLYCFQSLRDSCPMLSIVQCLKTIVSYILFCIWLFKVDEYIFPLLSHQALPVFLESLFLIWPLRDAMEQYSMSCHFIIICLWSFYMEFNVHGGQLTHIVLNILNISLYCHLA